MVDEYIVWTIAIVSFLALLPILRKSRLRFVSAGVLLLTPCAVYYSGTGFLSIWPLVLSIPAYFGFAEREGGFEFLIYYMLLPAIISGLIFWYLSRWAVPTSQKDIK